MLELLKEVVEVVLELSEESADVELVVVLVDLEELGFVVEAEVESEVAVDVETVSDVRGSELRRGVIGYASHKGISSPRDL